MDNLTSCLLHFHIQLKFKNNICFVLHPFTFSTTKPPQNPSLGLLPPHDHHTTFVATTWQKNKKDGKKLWIAAYPKFSSAQKQTLLPYLSLNLQVTLSCRLIRNVKTITRDVLKEPAAISEFFCLEIFVKKCQQGNIFPKFWHAPQHAAKKLKINKICIMMLAYCGWRGGVIFNPEPYPLYAPQWLSESFIFF